MEEIVSQQTPLDNKWVMFNLPFKIFYENGTVAVLRGNFGSSQSFYASL
jgi:hypothetical protein